MYVGYVSLHFSMLFVITVRSFLNLRFHMTGYDLFHIEYQCMFLANFYPVGDTLIVGIELKSNILRVSTKFLMDEYVERTINALPMKTIKSDTDLTPSGIYF